MIYPVKIFNSKGELIREHTTKELMEKENDYLNSFKKEDGKAQYKNDNKTLYLSDSYRMYPTHRKNSSTLELDQLT